MGKTRAECSQDAYTSHASAFLSHWIQILANSSPKSDIKKKKKKKKNPTLFFRILRSVGRGQHKIFFFWPYFNPSSEYLTNINNEWRGTILSWLWLEQTRCNSCAQHPQNQPASHNRVISCLWTFCTHIVDSRVMDFLYSYCGLSR